MAMNEIFKKTFMLWAKTSGYRNLVTKTRANIYDATRKYRCYVAFSGGKDSTVLLHLALQSQPEIPVFHWDYGMFMPREVEVEIQDNMAKLGAKNVYIEKRVSERKACKFGYQGFFMAVHKFIHDFNLEMALIGLRAEESLKRRRKTRTPPRCECYPLSGWGWRDVWAYIVSNNLPYPRLYDVYGPLLGYDRARFVTFFDEEFAHLGSTGLDGYFFPQFRNSNT